MYISDLDHLQSLPETSDKQDWNTIQGGSFFPLEISAFAEAFAVGDFAIADTFTFVRVFNLL